MREFFREGVKSGGSIPKRRGIYPYLDDCYKSGLQKLKDRIKCKKIMIFYDETCDSLGRFVSCILVASIPLPHGTEVEIFLGDVYFRREPLNNILVSQHVMKFVGEFQIPSESIVGYATDNVGYMILSYKNAIKRILPNAPHLSCICQIINLVVKDLMKSFPLLLQWSQKFCGCFSKSGARKHRFQQFLSDSGYPVKLPPQPISTRWTSVC